MRTRILGLARKQPFPTAEYSILKQSFIYYSAKSMLAQTERIVKN